MKRFGLTCAVLAFALGYPALAIAQEQVWVRDSRYGAGPGLRAGDLEFHPGIGAEFGYDSNYGLSAGADKGEPRTDLFALHITPSVTVATVGQERRESEGASSAVPKVTFQAGIAATYSHFISTGSAQSDAVGQPPLGASGNLRLAVLPHNPISVDVLADFARTIQPSNNPDLNFDQFSARFGGGITWAPGGGMFDWRLGYEYGLTSFEDDTPIPGAALNSSIKDLSSHYNQINTRGRWRFLPRTAILYDASATFIRYNRQVPGQLDSDPIRARLGINGLITSSFSLLAMVGWGASFYDPVANAQQYDGPIAQAELKWFITPNPGGGSQSASTNLSTLAVGYVRDFANSYLGDYYVMNRGYANLSYFLGSRFVLSLTGGVSAITYPTIYARQDTTRTGAGTPPVAGFTTPWIDATLFGEYRPSDTIGINTTLRYSSAGDHQVFSDQLSWTRYEAYIGVRFFL
jgi:hypothetical protein